MRENRQLITRAASDETLDIAFDWVCKRRVDYSHNSNIWYLLTAVGPESNPNFSVHFYQASMPLMPFGKSERMRMSSNCGVRGMPWS